MSWFFRESPHPAAWCLTLLAATVCLAQTGCVRRRMTIRSNPPGALAFVDDQEIGLTPVSTDFTYYGPRKFQLFKDGFETVTAKQRIPTPWYELPPLDFFAENVWPFEVRDERGGFRSYPPADRPQRSAAGTCRITPAQHAARARRPDAIGSCRL